jgi:hypothetical protein
LRNVKTLPLSNSCEKVCGLPRASIKAQGASGLGLEDQLGAVAPFLKRGRIAGEQIEVENGKNNNWAQLMVAIGQAQKIKAPLVIAKLDLLTFNAGFIFTLEHNGDYRITGVKHAVSVIDL